MKRAALLLIIPALAAAQTAPLGALRSSSPVVTNETDGAFLGWRGGNHILLGAGADTVDPGAPWPYHDIAIGAGALTSDGGVAIGGASTSSVSSVSVGAGAAANPDAVSVGRLSKALGARSAAIGNRAVTSAPDAVQIGSGENDVQGTVRIRDWLLLDSRGVIPPARLGSMPMRAALFSGSAVVAAPEVFLYWCTNFTAAGPIRFDVGAALPDDSDAMRWDLWISAGAGGFAPEWIDGVSWVGPNGPPEAARVAPGDTLMLRCTAVRSPSGETLVLAEYRATVAVGPSGCAPQTPRTAGRIRVQACDSSGFHPDGGADVYIADLGSGGAFGVAASLPRGADGIAYELWLVNASGASVTPVPQNGDGRLAVLGTLPSVPAGGRCVLRCRSVRDGLGAYTVATVEGATSSGGLGSALLASPIALPQDGGDDETDAAAEEEESEL